MNRYSDLVLIDLRIIDYIHYITSQCGELMPVFRRLRGWLEE
jgi:hypothetical protein